MILVSTPHLLHMVNLTCIIIFLLNPLSYQNDPDFPATSSMSGQYDILHLSLRIRHAAPHRAYRAWRLCVTHFSGIFSRLVRCLLKSKESINLAYREYGF